MDIYRYHYLTKEFLSPTKAMPDPEAPGEFLPLPETTDIAPPEAGENQIAVFNEGANEWSLVADYRGTEYWNDQRERFVVESLGESLPDGALLEEPEPPIEILILEKISRLDQAAELKIISGFNSAVLGEDHFYPSGRDDQLNLIGAAGAGDSSTFPCCPANLDKAVYTNWISPEHTVEQLQQLLQQGGDIKAQIKNDMRTRIAAAYAATNSTELDQISEEFA